MSVAISHRGICVSDLSAARRFYVGGLGFEEESDQGIVSGADFAQATGLVDASAHVVMLRHRSAVRLQLLNFLNPPAFGSRERRATNQFGFVHMCFNVDDVDAGAEWLRRQGGKVVTQTRTHFAENKLTLIFCTDPDSARIELSHLPQAPAGFSHSCTCVASIDASIPYYRMLGYEPADNYVLTDGAEWLATFNETPGIKLRAQLMRNAVGDCIELFQVYEPGGFGSREPRPFNQLGFTHMAFETDDLEGLRDKLSEAGGRWDDTGPIRCGGVDVLQGCDPDGVRIELIQPSRV